jgi:hypothetical protein
MVQCTVVERFRESGADLTRNAWEYRARQYQQSMSRNTHSAEISMPAIGREKTDPAVGPPRGRTVERARRLRQSA